MQHDLVVRGGTIIDGTGKKRFVGDIAVRDGRIAAIGKISERGAKEIDVSGLIVAPGVIDLHTHYDAQLHWDPYCTASGWHGTTTTLIGNCGFGFAPVRPGMSDRYMRMMENTEQVPYDVMKRTMSWDWETFPQWMDHLGKLPKGVNITTYLPLNALLSYVIGPDEAKRRRATEEEIARMCQLLNEAMDAGASGFSFSNLGAEGNSHVDHDQSPMPTDVMDPEIAYALADVLRARGQGIIQVLCEIPGRDEPRRFVAEELARRSGRPVIHNIILANLDNLEQHRSVLRWLDEMQAKGLNIWSQGFTFRKPLEITPMHYNNWDLVAIFRRISSAVTREEKMELVRDPAFRERFEREYNPVHMIGVGGSLETWILIDVAGATRFQPFTGLSLDTIAAKLNVKATTVFLDLLEESNMDVLFVNPQTAMTDPKVMAEIVRHPRVLAGISDGGAHSKHGNGGFWSTDMIIMLSRDSKELTLEELHSILGERNARAACLEGRGSLEIGKYADMMIYDADKLNYDPPVRYEKAYDLPGGDWRKIKRAVGVKFMVVNGEVTFENGKATGAVPGQLLRRHVAEERRAAAE